MSLIEDYYNKQISTTLTKDLNIHSKNRDRRLLYYYILKEIMNTKSRWKHIQKIGLVYGPYNTYTKLLKDAELITGEPNNYQITERGKQYIHVFRKLYNLLPDDFIFFGIYPDSPKSLPKGEVRDLDYVYW